MKKGNGLPVLNALTVDVEDYFHGEGFASHIRYEQWDSFTPRVERNVRRTLELFARHGARGTFFVLGWVAHKFPWLVREIVSAGHEVGSHGYKHRRLHNFTPEEFRRDTRDAIAVLTDLIQRPIECYRAPTFSIVRSTMWGLDILGDEGIRFDSSIFPVRHDLYGFPEAERFPSWYVSSSGHRIFEFPLSTIRCSKHNIGVGGGGYLRLSPYLFTCWAFRHINRTLQQPAIVYFHPWEIDPNQPRLRGARTSVLRQYTNLSAMEGKIERLLRNFRFSPLSEVCKQHKAYLAGAAGAGAANPISAVAAATAGNR